MLIPFDLASAFAGDDTPAPAPAPIVASAPADPGPPTPRTKPLVPPTKPFVPPPVFRLADSSGQVWTHPEGATLSRYVADRNALLANARQALMPAVPVYQFAAPAYRSSCPGGRCPRR